ncbi:16S rRNA (guanine(966)-N(2))-methyltransferase RsmD [Flavobacteriaceae bacterium Ap0902]|nr:16S rRNA (guanine(966)-N(2))-methyltransferase RsmD [Flavobacteriaceae bacterium Ap0902]
MRIISGRWKGKRLNAPKDLPTRPTTDFAKEALFNILNHRFYLNEVNVLDLFAGIGGVSFEFASRGAEKVHSVDQFTKCTTFITETAETLGFGQLEVFREDAFAYLGKTHHDQYDIIFADPPFDLPTQDYIKLIDLIIENQFLDEGGLLILEHPKDQNFEGHPFYVEHKKYGNIHFSFFEIEDDSEEE